MATITVTPSPLELGIYREQWEAFRADVESDGHRVVIETPVEQRDIGGRGLVLPPDWPNGATVKIVIDVAYHLATEVTEEVLGAVVAALGLRLKGRLQRQPPRVVVIVDGRGERLAAVEVPADED